MLTFHPAIPSDIPPLVELLEAYMRETFRRPWHGTAEALGRDGFGPEASFHTMMALAPDDVAIGFAVWGDSYDLHHCVAGAFLMDMYVRPLHRGCGAALGLVASIAAAVRARGGCYLRGQSVPNPAVQRMYERIAVVFPGAECNVGGRAFRVLADSAGTPARDAIGRLPEKGWNYEA